MVFHPPNSLENQRNEKKEHHVSLFLHFSLDFPRKACHDAFRWSGMDPDQKPTERKMRTTTIKQRAEEAIANGNAIAAAGIALLIIREAITSRPMADKEAADEGLHCWEEMEAMGLLDVAEFVGEEGKGWFRGVPSTSPHAPFAICDWNGVLHLSNPSIPTPTMYRLMTRSPLSPKDAAIIRQHLFDAIASVDLSDKAMIEVFATSLRLIFQ
jgi:hypothetical protein